MPAMVGMGLPRVSELVVDADLTIPVGYKLITGKVQAPVGQTLNFYSSAAAMIAYVNSAGLSIVDSAALFTDHINEVTASHRVEFPHGVKIDYMEDYSIGYIRFQDIISMAAGIPVNSDQINVNTIVDRPQTGAVNFTRGINTDDINEYTASHGIDLNDPVTLDALVAKLTQRYRTAAAGAVSRYASAAEVFIPNPGATPTQIKSSVTVPDWYAGATNTFTITFDGHSSAVSAGDEMYLTVNDVEVGTRLPLSSPGYSTKNQDIGTLEAGDVIKIMCVDTVGTGGNLYCRNFEILSADTVNLPISTETW